MRQRYETPQTLRDVAEKLVQSNNEEADGTARDITRSYKNLNKTVDGTTVRVKRAE